MDVRLLLAFVFLSIDLSFTAVSASGADAGTPPTEDSPAGESVADITHRPPTRGHSLRLRFSSQCTLLI